MSVPSSSSPRNEGGSEGLPPTYMSPGYSASDHFTTDARSPGRPRPRGTGSSGVRLLTMHYEKESVLTRHVDNYEEIERSAHALFRINKDDLIFVEANMGGKRMRIDPAIWAEVNIDTSNIWISVPPNQKPPRTVTLCRTRVDWGNMNNSVGVDSVRVPGHANVRDVKKAMHHHDPRLAVSKILLWNCNSSGGYYAKGNSLRDDEPATENIYSYVVEM